MWRVPGCSVKCADCAEPIRDREPILHCFDCGGWCHVECIMVDEDTADVRCEKCYWKHKRELRKDADNPPEEKKTLLSWDLEDEEKKAFENFTTVTSTDPED